MNYVLLDDLQQVIKNDFNYLLKKSYAISTEHDNLNRVQMSKWYFSIIRQDTTFLKTTSSLLNKFGIM